MKQIKKICNLIIQNLLFSQILNVCIASCKETEFYSSVAGLEELQFTESILLKELQNYVDAVREHIEVLQNEITSITLEHELTSIGKIDNYLNNPVNAFRLIKRLHYDWPAIEENIASDDSRTSLLEAFAAHKHNLSFPNQDDFAGSALALARLQETYQLDVAELANGVLNGVKYGTTSMTWQDCFVLGQHLHNQHHLYNHTVLWLDQSMQMLRASDYGTDSSALDFMEATIDYHREIGSWDSALGLTNYILSVAPERKYLYAQKVEFESFITDGTKQGLMYETKRLPDDYHASKEYRLYQQVCREEVVPTPKQQRSLRCYYGNSQNAPLFLSIEPFKVEVLHLDPYIVQFHGILSDADILTVKNLAQPLMQRSKLRDLDGGDNAVHSYRTSKSAGLHYTQHRVLKRMLRNVAEFSGLNMNSAEYIQIANYGIGGHYEPHLDCVPEEHNYEREPQGDRIATGIYYLSDVAEGGGTAFPFLRLLVKPEKGSILFWYNLHRSGDVDFRTKHAACPVLQGSKWISNIWIRLRNQDQVRPCELTRDNEISLPFNDYN